MQRYANTAQDASGNAVSSVTVSVYTAGTLSLATIYSDNLSTPKSNPFTNDSDGSFSFYAANGRYDVALSKVGYVFDTEVTTDILLFDYADVPSGTVAKSYLDVNGLTLSNGTDATNDIDISAGDCNSNDASPDDRASMVLTGVLVKQLDAAWAVGSNAGGRDIGTIADGTYHVWIIKRVDTGIVDALFSRNHDRSAIVTMTIASPCVVSWTNHGLQVGSSLIFSTTGALPTGITAGTRYYVISAGFGVDSFQISATEGGAAVNTSGTQSGNHTGFASIVMPANYTKKRRIGCIIRASGSIVAFINENNYFMLKVPANLSSGLNPGTAAVIRTLSTYPVGHSFKAQVGLLVGGHASAGTTLLVTDPLGTDTVPTSANAQVIQSAAGSYNMVYIHCRTDNAARLRTRVSASDANTLVYLNTHGWVDERSFV